LDGNSGDSRWEFSPTLAAASRNVREKLFFAFRAVFADAK
jgi:hypothetical protein